jgi:hypothetical protein
MMVCPTPDHNKTSGSQDDFRKKGRIRYVRLPKKCELAKAMCHVSKVAQGLDSDDGIIEVERCDVTVQEVQDL